MNRTTIRFTIYINLLTLVMISSYCGSCKDSATTAYVSKDIPVDTAESKIVTEDIVIDYDTLSWKEINEDSGILLDIRYATDNNFTKKRIYDCARCFLRPELADKILSLQKDIQDRYNIGLKLYDCYRPRPAQQLLWDIVPDARYVTPPSKGSMHNRGLAVDLTLVDADGAELDMGTPYDYFGERAYITYTDLSAEILKNRQTLRKLMEIHGLRGIRTEWWHFSLKPAKSALDDWVWECK